MLDIKILLDKESSFSGQITLLVNQGGVRAAMSGTNSIQIIKKDSFILFERPKST